MLVFKWYLIRIQHNGLMQYRGKGRMVKVPQHVLQCFLLTHIDCCILSSLHLLPMSWDISAQCLPKGTTMWPSSSVALWASMRSVASMHLEKEPWRLSIYSMTSTPDLTHWLIHGKIHLFIRQVLTGVCVSAMHVWSSGMPHRSPWSLHQDCSCFTVLWRLLSYCRPQLKYFPHVKKCIIWQFHTCEWHVLITSTPTFSYLPPISLFPTSSLSSTFMLLFVCLLTHWVYVELSIGVWTTCQ